MTRSISISTCQEILPVLSSPLGCLTAEPADSHLYSYLLSAGNHAEVLVEDICARFP